LLARIESTMSGGALPTEHLQALLYHPAKFPLFNEFWLLVYALWLPAGVSAVAAFAIWRWQHFIPFAVALLGLFYVSDLFFLLMPTQPPWMFPNVSRIITDVTGDLVRTDTNYLAAFPSLHVALPSLIAFRARASGMSRMWRVYAAFAVLTAFAVVYLGEHFVADAVGGAVLAWLMVRFTGRFASTGVDASRSTLDADRCEAVTERARRAA
jgi:membrane-associated phospholipid phosphatase